MKKRIEYIDAMRGFTMFLVVLGHVLFFSFGISDSFVASFFLTFRMPLFFFISGFIAYKDISYWTLGKYGETLLKKARIQLIPTIVFFLLYYSIYYDGVWSLFCNNGFGRFWFTFVLFEMFALYFSTSTICRRVRISENSILVPLAVLSILFTLFHFDDFQLCRILRIRDFVTYLPYFVFGLLSRKNEHIFSLLIEKDTCRTVLLMLFVLLLLIIHGDFSSNIFLVNLRKIGNVFMVRWIGLLFVISIFINIKSYFEKGSGLSRCMQFVGRRTLDIYMLHYFFLPSLPSIGHFLRDNSNPMLELCLGALIALCVMTFSLFVSWIIRNSTFLAYYLFGVKRLDCKKDNN